MQLNVIDGVDSWGCHGGDRTVSRGEKGKQSALDERTLLRGPSFWDETNGKPGGRRENIGNGLCDARSSLQIEKTFKQQEKKEKEESASGKRINGASKEDGLIRPAEAPRNDKTKKTKKKKEIRS